MIPIPRLHLEMAVLIWLLKDNLELDLGLVLDLKRLQSDYDIRNYRYWSPEHVTVPKQATDLVR